MKVLNKIKILVAALAVVLGGVFATVTPVFAAPANSNTKGVTQFIDDTNAGEAGFKTANGDLQDTIFSVINFALGAIGVLSVVMVIFGGFQYTISAGDSGKVTKAKNTILYGVIGLVIAMLAWAIVNFVITKVTGVGAGE